MENSSARVGIYTRISRDRTGQAVNVAIQEADARKLCEERGWSVAQVFCDNGRSAWDPRKPRRRYLDMLDAIRAGQINVVVSWHPDRLHRQLRELVPFVDLVHEYGVDVETVTTGRYDLSTPAGRMQARLIGVIAEYESEHKSERIRRKLEANAAAGKAHGGERPYGWEKGGATVVPAEADVIRQATALVLAGESITGVARALNAAGHTTSTKRPWRGVTVRDMLLRPRNAALRVHHGEEVGGGQWEPIIPVADFRQVEAILRNPSRRTTPGRDGRVDLLSVIARCGVCDGPMSAAKSKPYKGVSKPIYRCKAAHVLRDQANVDALVVRVVLDRIAQYGATLLTAPDQADKAGAAAKRVTKLQDRLTDAAEAFAAGTITMAQLTTINAAVRPQLDEAQTVAAVPSRGRVLGALATAADPAEVWAATTPQHRRAVVAMLVDVRILRTRTGPGFDSDAVEIVWK